MYLLIDQTYLLRSKAQGFDKFLETVLPKLLEFARAPQNVMITAVSKIAEPVIAYQPITPMPVSTKWEADDIATYLSKSGLFEATLDNGNYLMKLHLPSGNASIIFKNDMLHVYKFQYTRIQDLIAVIKQLNPQLCGKKPDIPVKPVKTLPGIQQQQSPAPPKPSEAVHSAAQSQATTKGLKIPDVNFTAGAQGTQEPQSVQSAQSTQEEPVPEVIEESPAANDMVEQTVEELIPSDLNPLDDANVDNTLLAMMQEEH